MNAAFDDFRHYYATQPHEVSIETQALCNARCTFCPYPTLERKGAKLSDETLDRLLQEFRTFRLPFYFAPFKVNEPFLDKRTIPLCERFNQLAPLGVLRLFSNGSALTDQNIEGVSRLRHVAHLWISLNEIDPAAYETTMGLNFTVTTKRLDRLHEASFRHPVVVSRVGGSEAERLEFIDYVQQRWPKFTPTIIKKDAWIDYTAADSPEVPDSPCVRWWELHITAEGNAVTCCMDDGETPDYYLGNVATESMLGIYNSPRAIARREATSRKQLDATSPCSRCSY